MRGVTVARYSSGRLAIQLSQRIVKGTSLDLRAAVQARRPGRRGDRSGGARLTDFDPLDPAIIRDPYPWYERLVEGPAVHYNPRRRLWIISHYDEVRTAAHDHSALSS